MHFDNLRQACASERHVHALCDVAVLAHSVEPIHLIVQLTIHQAPQGLPKSRLAVGVRLWQEKNILVKTRHVDLQPRREGRREQDEELPPPPPGGGGGGGSKGEVVIAETNAMRAKLGLKPLK